MHMPGHKRNPSVTDLLQDITEIDGFDNLHGPEGLIRDMELRAKDIWGSDDAMISVNGASALIFSSVLSSAKRGDKILIPANSHISVWHAVETAGLVPVLMDPEYDPSMGIYGRIDPGTFGRYLASGDIKAAVVTSPTYEGLISDSVKLHEIARSHGTILITDASHGAHFGIRGMKHFNEAMAGDLVIRSVHKTMAAPTQTAVMLIYGKEPDRSLLRHYLAVNESTSPSYVLMEALDRSLRHIDTDTFYHTVTEGRKALSVLTRLFLLQTDDVSKFVLETKGYLTGYELSDILRDRYNIEIEAAFPAHIIAMTGIGDTKDSLSRFTEALLDVDSLLTEKKDMPSLPRLVPSSERRFAMNIEDAVRAKKKAVSPKDCEGLISGEYLFAYPPGSPVLVPGEVISKDTLSGERKLKTDPFRRFDGTLLTVDM